MGTWKEPVAAVLTPVARRQTTKPASGAVALDGQTTFPMVGSRMSIQQAQPLGRWVMTDHDAYPLNSEQAPYVEVQPLKYVRDQDGDWVALRREDFERVNREITEAMESYFSERDRAVRAELEVARLRSELEAYRRTYQKGLSGPDLTAMKGAE